MSYKHPVRTYRKLDAQFWLDMAVAALGPLAPSAQALLLYLCLCREGHIIPGVVLLGVAAIAEILGWTYDHTKKCMDELVEAGEVLFDQRIRLIFVGRAIEVNAPDNPNVVKGWWRIWADIPDCDLKNTIHGHLECLIRGRGPSFLEAFQEACPGPAREGFVNRFSNPRLNGMGTQDTGSMNQEQEKEPGPGSLAWPGLLPCRDTGVPGQDQGLGSGPGEVRQVSPADWDRTIDDVLDIPQAPLTLPQPRQAPADQGSSPVGSSDVVEKAWGLVEAWNTKVALPNLDFERVEGRQAENLIPHLVEALKDPLAESEFLDLFEIIPRDPFFARNNPSRFKAFLAHYAKMTPEARKKAVGVARGKLARLMRAEGVSPKPKLKSETAAASLRKAQRTAQRENAAAATNNIYALATSEMTEA